MVTNRFQRELEEAFAEADEVWLGPIHRAERIPAEERLDRPALVEWLRASGASAHYAEGIEQIVEDVLDRGREGDVILLMSNGAFGGIYERFKEAVSRSVVRDSATGAR
jgi:UDP-N-acetylmuramate: L-alanyl-gamma-D-glutamyl-meso-diaminopimelate ligase